MKPLFNSKSEMRRRWAQLESTIERLIGGLADSGTIERIVGIPFGSADDGLEEVVRTAWRGLERDGASGRSLVLCVGAGRTAHRLGAPVTCGPPAAEEMGLQGFSPGDDLTGEHWGAMALVHLAARLQAPLLLLSPHLGPQPGGASDPGQGYAPDWIERMLGAVTDHGLDLALARFSRHPLANPVESLVAFPIAATVFGCRVRQPMPGVLALSSRFARTAVDSRDEWPHLHGGYGFDLWTTALAIGGGHAVGEIPLGLASFRHDPGMVKPIFKQAASALFAVAAEYDERWLKRGEAISQPRLSGPILEAIPPQLEIERADLLARLKAEFDHFDTTLYQDLVPTDVREELERWSDGLTDGIRLSAERWTDLLGRFLIAYCVPGPFQREDTVDGLFPFFLARLVTFVDEIEEVASALRASSSPADVRSHATHRLAERSIERQADLMCNGWPHLRRAWSDGLFATEPYLPRLGTWELIPNVELLVPQEIRRADGEPVSAHLVYRDQLDRCREQFVRFLEDQLGTNEHASSTVILERIRSFMERLEAALARDLMPYDLSAPSGAKRLLDAVVGDLPASACFQLTPEATRFVLERVPPRELIISRDTGSVDELLSAMAPNDALGLAAWTDRQPYLDQVLALLAEEARPDWFHTAALETTAVDIRKLEHLDELRGAAALTRLAGRLVFRTQPERRGGDLPTVWYLLRVLKRVASIELFSDLWRELALDGGDFAGRLVNTIRGNWGRRVLSAHHLFQCRQQRLVAERLARLAELAAAEDPTQASPSSLLTAAAEVYHLSITLPDTTFVPLSAWTWASFSHRGGRGTPTPLSSLVERDWATRDFVVTYLERSGRGGEDLVDRTIARLMSEGRGAADLGEVLLETDADAERIVVHQPHRAFRPAGMLTRPVQGPILSPIPEHAWESRYVLNAAAVRLDGRIHIIYRAFGDDQVSRLGLAWTTDGIHIDGRLDEPIFAPGDPTESAGCEDPRITVIGDRLYMLYTAYDGTLAQIAMASIDGDAFLGHRFDAWRRHGLGFPGLANKDAALYPEQIDGRYALYHRIDPAMWISYLDELDCPWPRTGHKIVVGPRSGMMWDGIKIGAGAQPIKTTRGWLNIYHGVDFERTYRLGVLLTDLTDPSKLTYQSPNPVFQPEVDFEVGHSEGGEFWVPRVVFTCGAVVARDTDLATMDDRLLVYYGAADTAIGVATARIGDLLPLD